MRDTDVRSDINRIPLWLEKVVQALIVLLAVVGEDHIVSSPINVFCDEAIRSVDTLRVRILLPVTSLSNQRK